jgi:hypothetical protein
MSKPATKETFYRCPGCGKMMDNRDLDASDFIINMSCTRHPIATGTPQR